jgi:hypothetical protein
MAIVVLIASGLILYLVTRFYWFRLDPIERFKLAQAIARNSNTLLAILIVMALPTALLLPLPPEVPRLLLVLPALAAWAVFIVAYWDHRVVPAGSLNPSTLHLLRPPLLNRRLPQTSLVTEEGRRFDGDVVKVFRWTFTAQDSEPLPMEVMVTVNQERYEAARGEERRRAGDWAHYARAEMNEIHNLTAAFYRLHSERDWSTLEQASNVLSFTQQCITYQSDEETAPAVEWPRYPIETLMDEVGDCEDDVILAAAVLKRLGFEVALFYYPSHCALGIAGAEGLPGHYVTDVRTGLNYFYGETTAAGWQLGEVPKRYRSQSPDMIEIIQRPINVSAF